ncbi:TerC family protein [Janthinobacterium sp. 17J80-10]|uniref:TerC family protein n=1 Tax=Janthinobacterium sp. 17J80-10 TaxID=2497863 RepID=UPI00100549C7|nr:TerC family protein [Janthinobacterium sp. 17J80-10]QAU35601.1 TerC family protein [Janthinobacterium sp. 17J80-10]
MDFTSPQFWIALLQIVAIDIVLGGDNAVVIGLACRRLPARERKLGILWGMVGAIGLRIVLIFFAVSLLAVPYLKIIGAVLLFWIGTKLLQPEPEEGGHNIEAGTTLFAAVKTIIIADAVMSLDNVIAIAGAAGDHLGLVIFGLLLSIPIILLGSQLVIKLMDRFPIVVVAGGALLGWIAGGMLVSDVAVHDAVMAAFPLAKWVGPVVGAILVVAIGKALAARTQARRAPALDDLAEGKRPGQPPQAS